MFDCQAGKTMHSKCWNCASAYFRGSLNSSVPASKRVSEKVGGLNEPAQIEDMYLVIRHFGNHQVKKMRCVLLQTGIARLQQCQPGFQVVDWNDFVVDWNETDSKNSDDARWSPLLITSLTFKFGHYQLYYTNIGVENLLWKAVPKIIPNESQRY